MDSSRIPSHYKFKSIPTLILFKFTFIQLLLLIILFIITEVIPSPFVKLSFPIGIASLIPFRLKLLPLWFSQDILNTLDGDDINNHYDRDDDTTDLDDIIIRENETNEVIMNTIELNHLNSSIHHALNSTHTHYSNGHDKNSRCESDEISIDNLDRKE